MQDVDADQAQNSVLMQQVHGDTLRMVYKKDAGTVIPKCDGIMTADKTLVLGVKVADCLPVIIKDKNAGIYAAIHAGWRGLEKQILKKAILKIYQEFNIKPENLRVYIGPHICLKHYEVGADLLSKFKEYKEAFTTFENKYYLDLQKIAVMQLINTGVKVEDIKIDNRCTYENSSLPSYRRNKTTDRLTLYSNFVWK